jgi:hypothetical protein
MFEKKIETIKYRENEKSIIVLNLDVSGRLKSIQSSIELKVKE